MTEKRIFVSEGNKGICVCPLYRQTICHICNVYEGWDVGRRRRTAAPLQGWSLISSLIYFVLISIASRCRRGSQSLLLLILYHPRASLPNANISQKFANFMMVYLGIPVLLLATGAFIERLL